MNLAKNIKSVTKSLDLQIRIYVFLYIQKISSGTKFLYRAPPYNKHRQYIAFSGSQP